MIEPVLKRIISLGDTLPKGIGGKARNLFVLNELGLNVPRFVVIPSEWFESFLGPEQREENGIPKFDQIQLPIALLEEIAAYFEGFTGFFAVRSSFRDEDAAKSSFAGQFKTRLFVPAENLSEAIIDVWSSCVRSNVATYQETLQLGRHYFLSIIIQEMVDADTSGVAFSINPVTGHRHQQIINAVIGVGEGLVSGDLPADQFIVTLRREVETTVIRKKRSLSFQYRSRRRFSQTSNSTQDLSKLNLAFKTSKSWKLSKPFKR